MNKDFDQYKLSTGEIPMVQLAMVHCLKFLVVQWIDTMAHLWSFLWLVEWLFLTNDQLASRLPPQLFLFRPFQWQLPLSYSFPCRLARLAIYLVASRSPIYSASHVRL